MTRFVLFDGAIVVDDQVAVDYRSLGFNYGASVFEGIRAYWVEEREQLFAFRLQDHVDRLMRSARMLHMQPDPADDDMTEAVLELLRKNAYTEDVYIRPIVYQGAPDKLGVTLTSARTSTLVHTFPQGQYLEYDTGVRTCVSSWRRISDNSVPPRGKIGGAYVNSALAKTDAIQRGLDEAILLTEAGTVSEGSTENIFLYTGGKLVTPAESEDILVGITRDAVIQLATNQLGLQVDERVVDRSELYTCDEAFFCGTGAEVTPIREVDGRQLPETTTSSVMHRIRTLYKDACHGRLDEYDSWLTPVYS